MFSTDFYDDFTSFSVDCLELCDRPILRTHEVTHDWECELIWGNYTIEIWQRAWPDHRHPPLEHLGCNLQSELIILFQILQNTKELVLRSLLKACYYRWFIHLIPRESGTCTPFLTWMVEHFFGFHCSPISSIADLVDFSIVFNLLSEAAKIFKSSIYNRSVTLMLIGLDSKYPFVALTFHAMGFIHRVNSLGHNSLPGVCLC